MECNKEEAVRAKGMAEKKMQNKDFLGARKIALKAQQLDPDLENISQLIMVCDVHCSAENKVYGNEKNWYGILKIEPTADEASIKKQYRKFALALHPDKNNFAGAADAFKLIGEAQRVLLDHEKRILYDKKCKASRPMVPNWASHQGTSKSNVGKPPWVQNNFTSTTTTRSFNPQSQQPQKKPQPGFPTDNTFWTVCPFCSVRYQFYRDVVNKLLFCRSCKKSFTGYEIKAQATPAGTNWTQPVFPHQGAFKDEVQGTCANSEPKVGSQRKISSEDRTRESVLTTGTSEVGRESKSNEKCGNMDVKINKEGGIDDYKSSGKVNGKRRKQVAESSSSDSEEDIVTDENGDVLAKQNFGSYREYPRRSTRSKVNVSYNENLSDDDDFENPLKRAKCSGSFRATEDPLLKQEAPKENKPDSPLKESSFYEGSLQNGKEEREKANGEIKAKDGLLTSSKATGKSSLNSIPIMATHPEIYEYPEPDFNDFGKDRREGCFAVGQTWAVYDTLGSMPRFYVRVMEVFSPGFKLGITWLEPDPDDKDEIKWVHEGFPVSCGKFKNGNYEDTEDHSMFSHLVLWEKGSGEDTCKIYPRKGETWALYKNWDMKWRSDLDSKRKYEYEFVEILSEYVAGIGVSVGYLGKVKGFSCLFCRTAKEGIESFRIPPNQLIRFSHRIPSFQMSGEEREDVPKGSFELDPASLPTNLKEIAVPQDLKVEGANKCCDISYSESPIDKVGPVASSEGNTSGSQLNKTAQLDSEHIISNDHAENVLEIPDPEFYDFDGEKSPEKFEIGQIWALYSDEDGLPKYYAQIMKIDYQPEFKLHITWLLPCPQPKNMIQWVDKKMLSCCGFFRLQKRKTEKYTGMGPFSHQIRVEYTDKKDVYAIFPKKGEVWALYKFWNAGMKCSDLGTFEYDMVEILEEMDMVFRVLVLEPVNGFKSVFKAQMKEGSAFMREIPRVELLRFSHQIPAFGLTEERGGSLRGYWELDTAALPFTLFCSS